MQEHKKYIWLYERFEICTTGKAWRYIEDSFEHVAELIDKHATIHVGGEEYLEQFVFDANSQIDIEKHNLENGEELFVCKEILFGEVIAGAEWKRFSTIKDAKKYIRKTLDVHKTMVFSSKDCLLYWKGRENVG